MLYLPVEPGYDKVAAKSFVNIRDCYYIAANTEMLYRRRYLEYNEIIYVIDGKIYISVNNVEYTLSPSDTIIVPCYQVIDGFQNSKDKTRFCTIEFSCSDELIDGLCNTIVPITSNNLYFIDLMSHMNTIVTNNNGDMYSADALLLLIINEIKNNRVKNGNNSDVVASVMEYIDLNIDKIMSIDEIAEHFQYSKDHLIRKFREQNGFTLKKYINEKKLHMVKRLLTTTNMSIEKISESIGYDDITLFIKFFKYHEKITPQRYRKIYK